MPIKENYQDRMQRIKKELDSVSPSFCVAKWQQVTIHLATGQTHSCHHPATHKIPLEEIKLNPSALHNTNFKKEQRKKMLEGERPAECDYCWRAEDAPGDHFSDRIKKSADTDWGEPYISSTSKMPWDSDVVPSYVEVSFSNACNFACSYCSPEISSTLMQTVKAYGPIKLSQWTEQDLSWLKSIDRMPIPNREHNPYIEAWWQWWPTLYPHLKVFRITGGEPLLSKETFRTLDWIIENPNPNLDLAINTNLGVDQSTLDKFFAKCQHIKQNNMVKRLQIFTSCDTWGPQAEYLRPGLDYRSWYYNLWNLTLRYPDLDVTIMCTFNLLSIPQFKYFLNDILAIRKAATPVNKINGIRGVNLDFPYLRHPRYLSALIADEQHIKMIEDCVEYTEHNSNHNARIDYADGFYPHEIDNLKRILNVVRAENPDTKENVIARHDFYLFIDQHDRRIGKKFLEIFPSLQGFYERCRSEYLASVAAKELALSSPIVETTMPNSNEENIVL